MPSETFSAGVQQLNEFFFRPVCKKGTEPLRKGVEIALFIDGEGPATLTRTATGAEVKPDAPKKPDMTFHVSQAAIGELLATHTEDVGEIGVAILKLMASKDASRRVQAKVHIGAFDLLRNGYLGVLPLGGATVMKFLASHGLTGVGKIKDAIGRLRT
jgi:hypothetical protein